MTIPSLRDLEQRWREQGYTAKWPELSQGEADAFEQCATDLAAVREALEQTLAEMPRYKVSELDGMLLPDPSQDGRWIHVSRVEAALGAKEPT